MQAVGDPAAPMLITLAADGIGATQEGPAHAAVNEVIPGRGIQRDERGTGRSHGSALWVGCYLNVASQEGLSNKWVSFYFFWKGCQVSGCPFIFYFGWVSYVSRKGCQVYGCLLFCPQRRRSFIFRFL